MDGYNPLLKQFPAPEPIKNADWGTGLLVRSTNWLGDALMTLPAVWQMRCNLPEDKKLFILAPKNLVPMWEACPFVDGVVGMSGKRVTAEEIAAVKALDAKVGMILPNSYGSASDIRACGIPRRCGRRGRWRRWMLTDWIRKWPRGENVGQCHQLSYYLELAGMLGPVAMSAECPSLKVDAGLAERFGMRSDIGPWLVLAPGAAYGPAKQWPAERFAAVAKEYRQRGWRIAVVGAAKEVAAAERIASEVSDCVVCAGKTDLRELMAVLSLADAVVANDSGAMHLAAALGRRGVAVFGSTDPVATGPIGGRWRLMVSDAECRPCFCRECPLKSERYHCLEGITVQAVLDALEVK